MRKNKKYIHMSNIEKQKTPLLNEVAPENAFIKLSTVAVHVADKYKLKALKLKDES